MEPQDLQRTPSRLEPVGWLEAAPLLVAAPTAAEDGLLERRP